MVVLYLKVYHSTKVFSIPYLRKGDAILYKKFQALLEKKNKTVYQVSKETGISQTAFSNWKSGRSTPSIESLKKLSAYFEVAIEDLLD
ncbi:helix-turn-helix transcriptional regulator [Clostridium sp. AF02-29]|uniref:helix-turn-helix domain-containing protein n=1 Tax=Clostridium sp. AF02-29 TaxID=2292993 RepID=UPI00325BCE3B